MPSTELKGKSVKKVALWAAAGGVVLIAALIVSLLVSEEPQPRVYEFALADFSVQLARTSAIVFEPSLLSTALKSISGNANELTINPCGGQVDDESSSAADAPTNDSPPDTSNDGAAAKQPTSCTYHSVTGLSMSPKAEGAALRDAMVTFHQNGLSSELHATPSKYGTKMTLLPSKNVPVTMSVALRDGADDDLSFNVSMQRKTPPLVNDTSLVLQSATPVEFLFDPQDNEVLSAASLSHIAAVSGELRDDVTFPLRRGYLCKARKGTRVYLAGGNWQFQKLTANKDGAFAVRAFARNPALSICANTLSVDGHKQCGGGTISVCDWDWIGYLKWVLALS